MKLTPLMKQYWEVKDQHQDKVLLFRMGDFYEIFYEDAELAAPILNITLTQRNKKSNDKTPMCGFPHHSVATPISKLLAEGHKVAICDQVEDASQAKGLVKRAVTRVLTPGMVYDPETLNELDSVYLCSFDDKNIAFLETSTGEAFYYTCEKTSDYKKLIEMLNPVEFVVTSTQKVKMMNKGSYKQKTISAHDSLLGDYDGITPAARLLSYATQLQGESILKTISPFESKKTNKAMHLNSKAIGHLEIFKTYKGDKKNSFYETINKTKTAMGGRLLKQWLQFPLAQKELIIARQKRVSLWAENIGPLKSLREELKLVRDLERRIGKISTPNCQPRDIKSLSQSLESALKSIQLAKNDVVGVDTSVAEKIVSKFIDIFEDDLPATKNKGKFIRPGYHQQLDEFINLSEKSQDILLALEASEKEKTGISNLKIRYNNVFGYYIEVSKAHTSKVPDHYKRKQTLTNAERYVTQELQEIEDKVLSANSKRVELELRLFNDMVSEVLTCTGDLLLLSKKIAELDCLSSLAWLAIEKNYRPATIIDEGIVLKASRHPVVEAELKHKFVPNDITIKYGECVLLTGPNMAGKSTIMRQVALVVLLNQIGSFVPADKAELAIFNKIYTRIGASDSLSDGLSTFMVEMTETSELLKAADDRTLVVLDEIGRGTSTYDGLSLAQAILEFIVTKSKASTLFATHYHELAELESKYSGIKNAHMSIADGGKKDIQFLYMLENGPANKSYGIQVAQLAGLPVSVIKRASELLKVFEASQVSSGESFNLFSYDEGLEVEDEGSGISAEEQNLLDSVKSCDLNSLTPIEALNMISSWKELIK